MHSQSIICCHFWFVDKLFCVPEVRICVDDAAFLRALTVRFFPLEIRQNHNFSVRGLLPNLLTKKKTKEPGSVVYRREKTGEKKVCPPLVCLE